MARDARAVSPTERTPLPAEAIVAMFAAVAAVEADMPKPTLAATPTPLATIATAPTTIAAVRSAFANDNLRGRRSKMERSMSFAISAIALAAAASLEDQTDKAPNLLTESQRSVNEIIGCFAEEWERRNGFVTTSPRQNGMRISLSYRIFGQKMTAVLINVDDIDENRKVSVFARKGDFNKKLRNEISRCV